MYQDKDKNFVFMADSAWTLKIMQEKYADVVFHFTSEFKLEKALS